MIPDRVKNYRLRAENIYDTSETKIADSFADYRALAEMLHEKGYNRELQHYLESIKSFKNFIELNNFDSDNDDKIKFICDLDHGIDKEKEKIIKITKTI